MNSLALEICEEDLVLLADKVLWWPSQSLLLVADIHLGKPASFRAAGVMVPDGSDAQDLERLTALLDHTKAKELCVLGDLIHNRDSLSSNVVASFNQWRSQHPKVSITLARGNHDRHAPALASQLKIDACEDHFRRGPFILQHEPEPNEAAYVIAGHTHPSVRLSEKRGKALRLPCCYFGDEVMTLPAFGSFTGTHRVRPSKGERIIVFAESNLTEVPWQLC